MKKMSIREKIEFLKAIDNALNALNSELGWYMAKDYDDGEKIGEHIPTIEENEYNHYHCCGLIRLKEELENLAD